MLPDLCAKLNYKYYPYFLRKKSVQFAWEKCETELQQNLSVSSVSNVRETDIYSVCYISTKKTHFIESPAHPCFMHRLAGGFVCNRYVTDVSNPTHLYTDLLGFFLKNTDRVYRVLPSPPMNRNVI